MLWALLGRGGGAFQLDVKPEIKKADRDALKRAGLIAVEKRGRKTWIELDEKGWAFAAQRLDAELPERSTAGVAILRHWLARLKIFLEANGMSLAEFIAPPQASAPFSEPLKGRIRTAYLDTTGGRLNTQASLSGIRARLPDVDRDTLDAALLDMHHAQEALLYPNDNRRALTDADRAAALSVAGEPRHILWIEK
jgi:hypothetical protein